MSTKRRALVSLGLVPGLITSSILVLAVAPANAAGCYVSGNAPYQSYQQVYGKANRAGCGDSVRLYADIMKDLPLQPDPQMGVGSRVLVNGSVTGSGPCDKYGRGNYYVRAATDTGQRNTEGSRSYLC